MATPQTQGADGEVIGTLLMRSARDLPSLLRDGDRMARVTGEYLPLMKGYPAIVADIVDALLALSSERDDAARTCALVSRVVSLLVSALDGPPCADKQDRRALGAVARALWPALRMRHLAGVADLARSVAANDGDATRAALRALSDRWQRNHHLFVSATDTLLTIAQRRYGPEGLEQVLRGAGEMMRPVVSAWAGLSVGDLACIVERLLIAHGSRFVRVETETKIRFHLEECASGGVVIRRRVAAGQPFGPLAERTRWAPYCAHCRVWNEELPTAWVGRPLFTVAPDNDDPSRCELVLEGVR